MVWGLLPQGSPRMGAGASLSSAFVELLSQRAHHVGDDLAEKLFCTTVYRCYAGGPGEVESQIGMGVDVTEWNGYNPRQVSKCHEWASLRGECEHSV